MTAPIYRREARFVLELLELLDQADEPIRWLEIVGRFTDDDRRPYKTVENVIYELIAFGAVHKVGRPHSGHGDTRALTITELGSAWLKGVSPPLVGG